MIRLDTISKRFGKATPALEEVSLTINEGEFIALVGESGSGKTTLLRIIAGLEEPSNGWLSINQQVVCDQQVFIEPAARGVGLVFQDYALFPHLNVQENITFGLHKYTSDQKKQRTKEVLELVGLDGLESRYPHELSGGQQQRVAIARAVAPNPQILLLDEPFSNLDTLLKAQVRSELRQIIKNSGLTSILVTHDIQDALSTTDRIALLKNGRLQQFASPDIMYQRPENAYVASFIGKANIITARYEDGYYVSDLWKVKDENPKGEEVKLVIRPHQIKLTEDDGLSAVLEAIEHYGDHKLFKFAYQQHTIWCNSIDVSLQLGEVYKLALDGSSIHAIEP